MPPVALEGRAWLTDRSESAGTHLSSELPRIDEVLARYRKAVNGTLRNGQPPLVRLEGWQRCREASRFRWKFFPNLRIRGSLLCICPMGIVSRLTMDRPAGWSFPVAAQYE